MKTVSNGFLTAWLNKGSKFAIQRIDYKRSWWNGAAIVQEPNWQSLTMPKAQFKSIGTMSFTLDTILQNEFKTSACVLSLLNNDYRWSPNNPSGVFGPDLVNGQTNYIAPLTIFQVYAGYEKADGTFEYVSMFAGIISDYSMKPMAGIFEATISGYEFNLQNTDAQLLTTAVTAEDLGVGGSGKVAFPTTSVGVAFVDKVYVGATFGAAVLKTEGVDYQVAGLDTVAVTGPSAATITMAADPGGSNHVYWTGRVWYVNKSVGTLAGLLCDAAGITAGNRTINEPIFPSGAAGSKTINTQAGWQAGLNLTNITTTLLVDAIEAGWLLVDDFSLGAGNWTAGSGWSVAGGVFSAAAPALPAYNPTYTQAVGSWQVTMARTSGYADFIFMGGPYSGFFINTPNKSVYWIRIDGSTLYLYRGDNATGSPGNPTDVLLASVGYASQPGDVYLVNRTTTGLMTVSVNGTLKITYTDNTHTASTSIKLNASGNATFTNIYVNNEVVTTVAQKTGVFESAIQDILSVPTAWGALARTDQSLGGTILYETASSTDGVTFDAYVGLSGANVIQSALKRYYKIRITITPLLGGGMSPLVNSVTVNFSTANLLFSLAVFRGMDCWSAMEFLAFVSNYDIGFNSGGKFFFQAKNPSNTPLLTFKQSDILSQIVEIKPGWQEIQNDIQVTYGTTFGATRSTSYKEYNYNSLPEPRPNSYDKFRQRLLTLSTTNFMFANDANLATGMSQVIHDDNCLEKRRVTMLCRLIPQVEIGDVMAVSHYEDPLLENNWFGDPLMTWAPIFGTPGNVALRLFKFKVLQVTHDFDKGTSRILGLEVLT